MKLQIFKRKSLKEAAVCRCLVVGDAHDLEVVFRLVQLWLKLGADGDVVAQLAAVFAQSPSHKFLPLMYQMASRLSAARAGPLIASGFQAQPSLMPGSFGEGCSALSVCTACLANTLPALSGSIILC